MIESDEKKTLKKLAANPAHFIAISFFCVIAAGSALLQLPISTTTGISFVDSMFVSVSAVCVTGLVTVDVSTCFTLFGKTIIMLLIQIGGLGIMTLAACVIWLLKENVSVHEKATLEYSFIQHRSSLTLRTFIYFLLRYTFIVELIGAIGFFFAFDNVPNIWERLFASIFHAVSSFCNAGFSSLYADNFVRYSGSFLINFVTCTLIILGGIGFIVVFEIRTKIIRYIYRKRTRTVSYRTRTFSLHSWIVIYFTIILIVVGSVLIYFMQNVIYFAKDLTVMESIFQSVTCRTAGFNTVDIGTLHNGTILIMIFLMFVGGSPGSTAGGIKTTTFGVLIFTMFLGRQNFETVSIRKRTIPHNIIYQALLVVLFSIFIITICVLVLTALEPDLTFISLLFETVSAFGTVGLTMNITPELCPSSKYVIMFAMYVGRIGSLTIFSIINSGSNKQVTKYVKSRVLIG